METTKKTEGRARYVVLGLLLAIALIAGVCTIGFWDTGQDVTGIPGYLSVDVGVNPRSELAVPIMEDTPGTHYQYIEGDAQIDIGNSPSQFNPIGTLSKWDGTAVLSVSLAHSAIPEPVPPNPVSLAPRGTQVVSAAYDSNTGINMYLLPEDSDTGGGLEYEIVLDRQPTNSTIVLNLASDNLSFAYQPPMTEDYDTFVNMYGSEGLTVTDTTVTKNGEVLAYRPENVVGSYALFNTTTREKFGQIYRPQLVDADGNRAWASQTIDEGTGKMYLNMPQDFLDNAAYPIIVDPTFGHRVQGTTWATVPANQITLSGLPYYYSGTNDVCSIFWIYQNLGGTNHFRMALYNSSLGLMGASDEGIGTSGASYSSCLAVSTINLTNGSSYYIAFNVSTSGPIYYDSWASAVYRYQSYSYGSWPATLSLSSSTSNWQWGVSAGYTTTATIYSTFSSSFDFGQVAQSGSKATGLSYFAVYNNSGATITVSIKATDLTTGSHTWALNVGGNPGTDEYALKSGILGGSYNHTVTKTNTTAWTGQTTNSTKYWGMTLFAPTTYTLDTGVFVGTVTLTTAAE